jgi:ATP-dependent Clp protease protease subunit
MKNTENIGTFFLDDETPEKNGEQDKLNFMVKELLDTRTLIISQGIDARLAKNLYSMLILLEKDNTEKPITVIINSPGGSADSGFGIYELLLQPDYARVQPS